jgi:hypothetical protein
MIQVNDKQQSIREQRLKVHRRLVIGWVICFFAMPVVLWNDWKTIFDLGATTLALCIASYVVFGGGFLLFFLHRYKKIASRLGNE